MTDLRKAAEMALEALEKGTTGLAIRAIPALRQALAQTEQKPVMEVQYFGEKQVFVLLKPLSDGTKLYTSSPSKPWQSLTGDEIDDIAAESGFGYINVARAIEAKLKEKNNG